VILTSRLTRFDCTCDRTDCQRFSDACWTLPVWPGLGFGRGCYRQSRRVSNPFHPLQGRHQSADLSRVLAEQRTGAQGPAVSIPHSPSTFLPSAPPTFHTSHSEKHVPHHCSPHQADKMSYDVENPHPCLSRRSLADKSKTDREALYGEPGGGGDSHSAVQGAEKSPDEFACGHRDS
jgi:hypothetical protein